MECNFGLRIALDHVRGGDDVGGAFVQTHDEAGADLALALDFGRDLDDAPLEVFDFLPAQVLRQSERAKQQTDSHPRYRDPRALDERPVLQLPRHTGLIHSTWSRKTRPLSL